MGNNKKTFFMKPLAIEESLCVIKEYKLLFSFFQKNLPPLFKRKKLKNIFSLKKDMFFSFIQKSNSNIIITKELLLTNKIQNS